MRVSLYFSAIIAVFAGCAPQPAPLPDARADMIEEDSHPHEVRPGRAALFHVPAVTAPSRIDVKCSLRGPAPKARLEFHGIRATGWAAANPVIGLGEREVFIDIEGIVEPGHAGPHFAIVNDDGGRLLWHQCYNN